MNHKRYFSSIAAVVIGAAGGLAMAFTAQANRENEVQAADIYLGTAESCEITATLEEDDDVVEMDTVTYDAADSETDYEFVGFSHVKYDADIYSPYAEQFSNEDIELIARLVQAEAGIECEVGQRLVIDVVLNRLDSEYFPDTVYDVIFQPYHFTVVWNGSFDTFEADADICEMVREELQFRTDADVIFFRAEHYSEYGVPMFQIGNHYFSSYEYSY